MAITAASLVATVSVDGASAAQEQLAQLGISASQAQSRLNQMQQGEGEASTSLGGRFVGAIKGGVSGLLDFGSKVGMTVMGFKGLYDGAVGLASGLLSSNASMEQTKVAFTTLLGSSKAAGDYLQQLQAFAASTPFEFPEVATAAQHMIAFGFSAKDVLPALTDIGDAMSAMGKGSADVDHIVEIFGQMKAAGKVSAQDMMQMASEGIPAWKYLAEAMGKTVPEVQKLSSQGLIPADVAIKDIEAGMHKAFGGGMQAQAMTFNGLLSTFKDNIGMAWRAFTGPLFDAAKQGLVVMGNLVTSPAFQNFAANTGKAIAGVFGEIGQAVTWVGNVLRTLPLNDFREAWQSIRVEIGSILTSFSQLARNMAPVGDSLEPLADVIQRIAGAGLKIVTGLLWDVSAALMAIDKAMQGVKGSGLDAPFKQLSDIVGGVFANHMKTASAIIKDVGNWFNTSLVPAIHAAMPGFQSLANTLITVVVPALVKLWAIAQGIIDQVFPPLVRVVEAALPVIIRLAGIISAGLSEALKFLMPYVLQAAQAIGQFAGDVATRIAPILINFFHNLSEGLTAFQRIWSAVWPVLAPILKGVWDEIVGVIKIAWALVSGIIKIGLDLLSGNWGQAWNDLKDMLGGVWDGIKTVIKGGLEIINGLFLGLPGKAIQWAGDMIHGFVTGVTGAAKGSQTGITAAFSSMWSGIQTAFHAVVDTVVNIAKTGFQILLSVILAPIHAIVAAFEWLYNHNYYFKALIDAIVTVVQGGLKWLQNAWNDAVNWVVAKWIYFRQMAEAYFAAAQYIIQQKIQQVQQSIQNVIGSVVNWVVAKWNYLREMAEAYFMAIYVTIQQKLGQVQNAVQGAINTVVGVFSSIWGRIAGPLGGVWNNIAGWFNNLAGQAFSWGSHVISGFVDGIRSMIDSAGKAASDVVNNVKNFLGFHSPAKMGEGRYIVEWGQGMIEGFNQGVMKAIPQLQTTVNMAVTAGTAPMRPAATVPAPFLAQSRQPAPQITVQAPPIYLDGRILANGLLPHITSAIRYGTGVR